VAVPALPRGGRGGRPDRSGGDAHRDPRRRPSCPSPARRARRRRGPVAVARRARNSSAHLRFREL